MKRVLIVFLVIILVSCASQSPAPTPTSLPPTYTPPADPGSLEMIVVDHTNLFPDGFTYDQESQRFLLTSITESAIYQVFDNGEISPFIDDPDLELPVSIEIDPVHNRLLVSNNSLDEDKGRLHAYDLKTGERIFVANLYEQNPNMPVFAYDIAIDSKGIAYVVDYKNPVIYRVDMDGLATTFIKDSILGYSLNGIVAHPDDFLLLGNLGGKLLKIAIENPEVIQVEIPDGVFDYIIGGMVFHPDGNLFVVSFPDGRVDCLQSTDNWGTASLVGIDQRHVGSYASDIEMRGEEVYIIYSHIDIWKENRDQEQFEIVLVNLEY